VFGMGTGVTLAAKPPTKKEMGLERSGVFRIELPWCVSAVSVYEDRPNPFGGLAKPLGRLVLLG
jgi:hypothetical protein